LFHSELREPSNQRGWFPCKEKSDENDLCTTLSSVRDAASGDPVSGYSQACF
jgi:hypothetical protein